MKKDFKPSFSGHDKFECKIDWITKGLQEYKKDFTIFSKSNIENSIAKLGLGINMIKSLSYWMKVLGLIENNKLTEIAINILNNDIYLENTNSLWLLHWNYVKKINQSTLAYLFFNKFFPYKFTKNELIENTILWLDENGRELSLSTLKSDIEVFVKLYKENDNEVTLSLFSDLNILSSTKNDIFLLNIDPIEISDEVFLYILLDFIERSDYKDKKTISVADLEKGNLSIQRSLCMSENRLYQKIYKLKDLTNNKIYYSEASGLRQIYIHEVLDKSEILKTMYQKDLSV